MLETKQLPPPVPALAAEWVMRLEVICAEEIVVGDFPEGKRLNYPILSGHFEGPALRGEVMAGGADWYLDRKDGIGQPNARYCLKTHDGVVIQVSNNALLRYAPGVVESALPGWPPAPELYSCRCTPVFQAPAGPYAWLNQAVFVGEIRYESLDGVTLDVFRLV
jgi:Protein of unknown function (DUF3237)